MNDFTLNELILIRDNLIVGYDREENNRLYNTYQKLSDMINNYCEHECRHEFKREVMQIDLCDKCHSFKFVFTMPNGDEIHHE